MQTFNQESTIDQTEENDQYEIGQSSEIIDPYQHQISKKNKKLQSMPRIGHEEEIIDSRQPDVKAKNQPKNTNTRKPMSAKNVITTSIVWPTIRPQKYNEHASSKNCKLENNVKNANEKNANAKREIAYDIAQDSPISSGMMLNSKLINTLSSSSTPTTFGKPLQQKIEKCKIALEKPYQNAVSKRGIEVNRKSP